MKNIFFDLDSTALLSLDGRARPFMDIILEYCAFSGINVSCMVSPKHGKRMSMFYEAYDADNNEYISVCKMVSKGGGIPAYPDLVISCDAEYLQKYPGLLVPPYDPDRSNRFAELAFAGELIKTIKDKVVLNRHALEKQVAPEPEPEKKDDGEDFSNWAYTV